MAKHARPRTISLPWRRVQVALPSIALISGALAVSAPTGDIIGSFLPKASTAGTGLVRTTAPVRGPAQPAEPVVPAAREAPALVLPHGVTPGSSTLVTLDDTGIPVGVLAAYRRAAALIDAADPACNIDWALLAAIGRVESDHARFGGSQLDSSGVAQPRIIGIALDGSNGTALISDTDNGELDGDTTYDRAMGPMQFIPETWRAVASDADGDGSTNPQDMADAATATATYLCSGNGDLSRAGELRAALMRYNASDSYVRTVTAIADAYRHGVSALPASVLPDANNPAPAREPAAPAAPAGSSSSSTTAAHPAPREPAPAPPGSTPTGRPSDHPSSEPSPTPTTPPPSPALPVPSVPPRPAPTPITLPTPPLTQEVCVTSPLGVTTCAIVPLS